MHTKFRTAFRHCEDFTYHLSILRVQLANSVCDVEVDECVIFPGGDREGEHATGKASTLGLGEPSAHPRVAGPFPRYTLPMPAGLRGVD